MTKVKINTNVSDDFNIKENYKISSGPFTMCVFILARKSIKKLKNNVENLRGKNRREIELKSLKHLSFHLLL